MAKKKKSVPKLNSTSTADIAFMFLLFFLLTTSMDTDRGLPRRLPPPVPKDQKKQDEKVDIKKRNLLVVLINSNNQILCGSDFIPIDQLKDRVKEFVENTNNNEHMPEKIDEDVPYFGNMKITKNHIISLQNDRGTSYQAYIDVQGEIALAYTELRNDLARKKFGVAYSQLTEEQQEAVQKIYPQKISEAEPKNYGGVK
jgi:biopolymer transport protein ExbD